MWRNFFSAPEIAAGITRRGIFWRGLLFFLIGVIVALEPFLATFTLAAMFGWGLVFGGIWVGISACHLKKRNLAWGLYGLLLLSGGILLLLNPEAELVAFAWSAAVLLLTGGMIGISICLAACDSSIPNLVCFISSIFSILLGSLLFLCPISGIREMFWFLGVLLAAEGLVLMWFSFRLPSEDPIAVNGESIPPIH